MSTLHKSIKDDEKEWPSENREAYFEALFHTYYKQLCRFSFRIVHDRDKAEDVVQTCFINFWNKRESTSIQTSFKAYLFRSVYNRSINEYTRSKKIINEEISVLNETSSSASDDPELLLQAQDVQKKIDQAIAAMPDGCRTVFMLSREDQLSYKEIAEMLHISIKTVENQMGKALRIMREHLFILLIICLSEDITHFFNS
ncbi:RNA polymerase sigma-70 factor [Cytophaga aurantiaca]|uniref:RNA polymerase sigma-70 factor n=1 Tax=Cytophaga aurantiaca TaxID=29530 RepID=UPI0003631E8E|nr:RNA polymerase sigma-70 factor [Cytophaga aurantiaca]